MCGGEGGCSLRSALVDDGTAAGTTTQVGMQSVLFVAMNGMGIEYTYGTVEYPLIVTGEREMRGHQSIVVDGTGGE